MIGLISLCVGSILIPPGSPRPGRNQRLEKPRAYFSRVRTPRGLQVPAEVAADHPRDETGFARDGICDVPSQHRKHQAERSLSDSQRQFQQVSKGLRLNAAHVRALGAHPQTPARIRDQDAAARNERNGIRHTGEQVLSALSELLHGDSPSGQESPRSICARHESAGRAHGNRRGLISLCANRTGRRGHRRKRFALEWRDPLSCKRLADPAASMPLNGSESPVQAPSGTDSNDSRPLTASEST